ncbi:MAG: hypothetical protein CHACPFDD_02836 [Phycisphaerae bacterium]|nr:hypothetical protein [Phycisphaerae bacterium]
MSAGTVTRMRLVPQVVLAVAAVAASAAAGDSVLLKAKPDTAGSYAEYAMDAVQDMPGPDGKPMQVHNRSTFGVLVRTAVGATDGAFELSATLDRLSGFLSFTEAIKSAYDSDDPDAEDASPDHKAAYTPILNAALKITLDANGAATAVDGGEAIRKRLLELGPQNFIASSLASDELSDPQIMSTLGETPFILLPNREVKVGETWTKTQHDTYWSIGKVILTYECTLERVEKSADGETAIIAFKGTIAKDAAEQPAEGKRLGKIDGSFTGTGRFSLPQARFVGIRRETKSHVEIAAPWVNDPAAPLMKVEIAAKHTYTVSPAAERVRRKEEIARRVADARAAREAEEAAAMAGPVDPPTAPNEPVAWLQWGGPARDFRSNATGLANRWPKGGPPRLWERPLGDGFSSILCDGAAIYTMYSLRDKDDAFRGDEVVVALDARTGQTLWEYKYDAPWPKDLQMEFGPGPHSTPLIVGDRIFTVGTTAKLHCLEKGSGKLIWSMDLLTEYKAAMNMRGFGSSPLAYQGNVLLPVSAEKGHSVMAFAQSDGAVAWKGGDFAPGYASLLAISVAGKDQLVAFTGTALCGLDPADAHTLWSVEHSTQFGANISTPVWNAADQHLFISSAYGMGSRGVKLESSGGDVTASEAWANTKVKVQHGNAVRAGDWVYASSGDFGPAFLACLNARTGALGWRQRGIAKATLVSADGKLIVLDEDGTLFLVKADPEKYRLLAKAAGVCAKTAWTVPTLHGRTLFVRDRAKIMALDLGGGAVQ